jgi:preprotein translocase subunit Sss1
MATTKPLPAYARPGRLARRPQRFEPHQIARLILIVLALIGTVAIALLVLGLVHVHAVTNHVRIH